MRLAWLRYGIVFILACLYAVQMLFMIRFLKSHCAQMPLAGTTAFLTAVLLLITACGEQDANNTATTGAQAEPLTTTRLSEQKVLKLAIATAIPSLDPLWAGSAQTNMLLGAIHDRLYRYALLARPYQLLPQAAVTMPEISSDGLHYTITLRSDRRFHADPNLPENVQSGRPLLADDVIYALLRHFDPDLQSPWRWLWAGRIEGLDAWARNGADYAQPPAGLQSIDTSTLRITLTRPQSDFVHLLAHPSAAIVMREAIDYYADDYGLHAIGSGPYRLQDLSLSGITLVAASNHPDPPLRLGDEGYIAAQHGDYTLSALEHRTAPQLDRINIQIQRNAGRRLQLLRDGEIDLLVLEQDQYPEVLVPASDNDAAAGIDTHIALTDVWQADWYLSRQPAAQWLRIDFNLHSDALGPAAEDDDSAWKLRCALRDSIDWHSFNQRFYQGTGYVQDRVISPLARATRASAQAAIGTQLATDKLASLQPLPELVFAHVDSRRNHAYFDWFQEQLTSSGYPPERLHNDAQENLGALLQAYRDDDLPLLFSAWSLDLPTATNTLQLYASVNANHQHAGPGLANYDNPAYDQAFAHLAAEQSTATDEIRTMQELLHRDCVTSAGFIPASIHLWNRQLIAWPDAAFAASEWLRLAAPANQTFDP